LISDSTALKLDEVELEHWAVLVMQKRTKSKMPKIQTQMTPKTARLQWAIEN
jgi:hypothetical protein